jgi:hypothetical protein
MPEILSGPILAILAGGGATLAGVALQSYLSSLREMKAWKWERRTRWDENKFEHTSFLVHLNKCTYEISMYAAVLDELSKT